ncbi:MAG TPA: hypothetical protein VKB84_14470 [Candidatus Binataceae bacterium]|nr:hypothetical protein [Candidatus Binataceae bacterium]
MDVNLNTASVVQVSVTDTAVSDNTGGLVARNAGAGRVFLALERTTFSRNSSFGLMSDGSGAGEIRSAASDSMFGGNGTALLAAGGPAVAVIQVNRSTVVNSVTTGALSNGTAGQAFILISNTLMAANALALSATGTGNLISYQNNSIGGNFSDGAFTGTITLK